jgi:DNA polymerase III subunit epsilon
MIRQVVLDTETTGLDPDGGDRIVEIGCLELINHMPTERHYRTFVNPDRPMTPGASQISGITDAFLADKPRFAEVADAFLEFIADSELIIHNATFDLKFLNAEFRRIGAAPIGDERAFCTLTYARRKFPGAPASLDALCRRFGIDLSERTKHGALIDVRLLADAYLELIGGRQPALMLATAEAALSDGGAARSAAQRIRPAPLPSLVSADELAAHAAFVEQELGDHALWRLVA